MGIIVEVDSRGRITIPAEVRRMLKARRYLVTLKGGAIELKPVYDEKLEALKALDEIKLIGDPNLASLDAAKIKHRVGGRKH